jgi:frataxin-like iron-binding protein CyaY
MLLRSVRRAVSVGTGVTSARLTPICVSSFSNFTPTTRKKRDPNDPTKFTNFQEPESYNFEEEMTKALAMVHKAVQPLEKMNKGFKCEYVPGNYLIIETPRGEYQIGEDPSIPGEMLLVSYFSGYHNYFFDGQDWLSTKDRHDMRGLLTRDIMRHWNGVPKFD